MTCINKSYFHPIQILEIQKKIFQPQFGFLFIEKIKSNE
jgi:hypothetical protein